MDKYSVMIMTHALRELDEIYTYISRRLHEPKTALSLIDEIEREILSLEYIPYRCSERKIGAYANKGYRQLFVKNYTIVFRIDERNKQVIITTIRYSKSSF